MSIQAEKRYFKADEYHRMEEAGIFSEDDRIELIEGEIVEMTPIGRRHAACVARLTEILGGRQETIVWVQNPVRLDEFTELQPDVALLRRREDFYSRSHPEPGDVLLAVEVADTSAAYDREVKLPLYARSGIPEVWIVDLNAEAVEVYTNPENGEYQSSRRAGRGDPLAPQDIPGFASVSTNDVLG